MHQEYGQIAVDQGCRIQIQDLVLSNGNKAAVRLVNRGVHKGDFFGVPGSGHEVSWASAAFFTFHDTKITDI